MSRKILCLQLQILQTVKTLLQNLLELSLEALQETTKTVKADSIT